MTGRACETCLWWEDETRNGMRVDRVAPYGLETQKVCAEGPVHYPTHPRHRCGRYRLAERLCGGQDARAADAEA